MLTSNEVSLSILVVCLTPTPLIYLFYHSFTGFDENRSCNMQNISSEHLLEYFSVKVTTSILILMLDLAEIPSNSVLLFNAQSLYDERKKHE